jgi:hypothetical protein
MKKFITSLTFALMLIFNTFCFADLITIGPDGFPQGHGDYRRVEPIMVTPLIYRILPLVIIIAIIKMIIPII